MLIGLSIRDVVLIDRLELPFEPGLCVLTGETGAGKSIVLDSLGLVLGGRGDAGLVRPGTAGSTVSAEFEIAQDHPVRAVLEGQGLEGAGGSLILRRSIGANGRSRAFVNDQAVSIGLLRRLGALLIEIHGQHGALGLLDPSTHSVLLDSFGGHAKYLEAMAKTHDALAAASRELATARSTLAAAAADADYLRHCADELDLLAPQAGEETALAEQRQLGMHGEKVIAEIDSAVAHFGGEQGIETRLRAATRAVERVAGKASGLLDPALAALERMAIEADEAVAGLDRARRSFDLDPGGLDAIEERLFALRAAARKHRCPVDDLSRVQEEIGARLAGIADGTQSLAALEQAQAAARGAFEAAARKLTKARKDAARELDRAVARELAPLKLGNARFTTRVEVLPEARWGALGADRVGFEATTVPGAPSAPIAKIASGGELSRFMLAIKVVLARKGSDATLIFDEVDHGIGGAVADAVGERLGRLAEDGQIVVVTHSPQVAARATTHWRVARRKAANGAGDITSVIRLDEAGRREEIARMLAGAEVTDEARAAAASLIGE